MNPISGILWTMVLRNTIQIGTYTAHNINHFTRIKVF